MVNPPMLITGVDSVRRCASWRATLARCPAAQHQESGVNRIRAASVFGGFGTPLAAAVKTSCAMRSTTPRFDIASSRARSPMPVGRSNSRSTVAASASPVSIRSRASASLKLLGDGGEILHVRADDDRASRNKRAPGYCGLRGGRGSRP